MPMQLSGDVLIACNCDWGCPCNFNARPTKGHCQGGWIWKIEAGRIDGVQVDGLALAVFSRWPAAIHEGGGQATAFIDERADTAQRTALTRLANGELGGPWGIFIKTYRLAPPAAVPFEFRIAQHASSVIVGDVARLQMTPIRNPVTQAEAHPEMILPEGLVVKRGGLAMSSVFAVKGDVGFDHSGQYAAFGRFSYS